MPTLDLMVKTGLYAMMALSVVAAIGAVTLRSLFHSALALAAVLIGIAGVYLALHADFLAMVQVLVYVGAVMTLIIFAIMLTSKLGSKTVPQKNKQSLWALIVCAVFLAGLMRILTNTPWPTAQEARPDFGVSQLGQSLMTTYVFPFEVIGVILFAVLIGALVIARKDKQP